MPGMQWHRLSRGDAQPVRPGRKIYPAPCKNCGGKGRIKEDAMRALNRHVERVFNPSRKDPHRGRRRLARDQ
jgi:hypothetical protein